MAEILSLGNLNISILEKEFGKLQTSEIIITDERIKHIKERHSIDYKLFEKRLIAKNELLYSKE